MASGWIWVLVVGGVLLILAALFLHLRSRTKYGRPAGSASSPGVVAPPKESEEMVCFKRVSEEYYRRKSLLDEDMQRIDTRLAALRGRRIEDLAPEARTDEGHTRQIQEE